MKGGFLHGKYFETDEEMLAFAKKWPHVPADSEQLEIFLHERIREAEINIIINPDLTNSEMYNILKTSLDCTGIYNMDWIEIDQEVGVPSALNLMFCDQFGNMSMGCYDDQDCKYYYANSRFLDEICPTPVWYQYLPTTPRGKPTITNDACVSELLRHKKS